MNLLSPSLWSLPSHYCLATLSPSTLPKPLHNLSPLEYGSLAFLMATLFSPFKSALQCHFLRKAFLGSLFKLDSLVSFNFKISVHFFLHSTILKLLILLLYFPTDLLSLLCLSLEGKFHKGNISVWVWDSYIPIARNSGKRWTCKIGFIGSMGSVSKRASFQRGIPVFFLYSQVSKWWRCFHHANEWIS